MTNDSKTIQSSSFLAENNNWLFWFWILLINLVDKISHEWTWWTLHGPWARQYEVVNPQGSPNFWRLVKFKKRNSFEPYYKHQLQGVSKKTWVKEVCKILQNFIAPLGFSWIILEIWVLFNPQKVSSFQIYNANYRDKKFVEIANSQIIFKI